MDKMTVEILEKWLLAKERLGASYEFYRMAKALESTLKAQDMGMNASQFIAKVFKAAEQPHLDKRVQAKILDFLDTLPKEWRAKVPDDVILRLIPAGKWPDFRNKNWVEENRLAAASLSWNQMVVNGSVGHQAFEFHFARAPEKKFVGGYSAAKNEYYLLSGGGGTIGSWASQPEYEQALASLASDVVPKDAQPDRVISKIAVTCGKNLCIGIRSGDGKLVLPGGHVEKGESPLEAAVRELAEETGISAQEHELSHLGTKVVLSPRGYLMEVHAYSLEVGEEVTSVANDPDGEVLKWLWVDTSAGLPEEVLSNLYVPIEKDYLLQCLGLVPEVKVETVTAAGQKRTVYRALSIESKDDFLKELETRGTGIYWASSEDKAVIYWGDNTPLYVVLEAEVDEGAIDKEASEYLNQHPDYAGEDEVRLLPHQKVFVKTATFHQKLSRKDMTRVIFGEMEKPVPEVVVINKMLDTGKSDH